MRQFSYANFSKEAREAVMTAADVALSAGSSTVQLEHLAAAVGGAPRGQRAESELGEIPFHLATVDALNRAHDAAVDAGEAVELRHLRDVLSPARRRRWALGSRRSRGGRAGR